MAPEETIEGAWRVYLQERDNVICVEVTGGFVIVSRNCSNCIYFKTDETKNCYYSSSIGCHKFKLKINGG